MENIFFVYLFFKDGLEGLDYLQFAKRNRIIENGKLIFKGVVIKVFLN